MLKIENLIAAVFDTHFRVWSASGITMGIPLITADQEIIRWNKRKKMLQVIGL